MKKVIRRADGMEETVEGTPEEIRQYERIAEGERSSADPNRQVEQKIDRRVIRGKDADDLPDRDAFTEAIERIKRERRDSVVPSEWPWGIPRRMPYWLGEECLYCRNIQCSCHLWSCHNLRITCSSDSKLLIGDTPPVASDRIEIR